MEDNNWKETRLTRLDHYRIRIESRQKDVKHPTDGEPQFKLFTVIDEGQYPWAFAGYYFKMLDHGGSAIGQSVVIRQPLEV